MGFFRFFRKLAFPGRLVAPHRAETLAPAQAPLDWAALRAPLTDQDRVLVSETHLWLRTLPRSFHPRQLCIHFPRTANRIARCWHDPELVDRLLQELLTDQRGNRTGFPGRIVEELRRLRYLHEQPYDARVFAAVVTRRPQPVPARPMLTPNGTEPASSPLNG